MNIRSVALVFVPTLKVTSTLDHVSYGGPRPTYRPIHRSICSVDTRPSIGRYSIEYRPMYRPIVHLMILMGSVDISTAILSVVYRSTIGYISVKYRSIFDRVSIDSRSTSFYLKGATSVNFS